MVTEDKSIGFPDDALNVVNEESSFVGEAPAVASERRPRYRRRWYVLGIALAVAAAIAALLFGHGRTDQATSGDPSLAQSGPGPTIKQYIQDSGISSTQVRRGDPGVPLIGMGLPTGWSGLGADTPPWSYGTVQYDAASDPSDPPIIDVLLFKLTGDVDPAKILEFAPNELKNLQGYEPVGGPNRIKLSGFDAVQLAGRYKRDGKERTIAQKTVVIPSRDALYVMQINIDALNSDVEVAMAATRAIDGVRTVITP